MDFHAWFEAYLGGRWYTFDARHNVPRIGRVVIGRGRDAVDVALTHASTASSRLNAMTVWADEVAAEPPQRRRRRRAGGSARPSPAEPSAG